ncbi:MAG: CoA transferase [Acidimicrobiales bacterium]|nr:CoA transferase [Acidimicrobiales bacterium]
MSLLSGLRVIDLTGDSGRFATKLLTEFGADVVRVTDEGSSGQPMKNETGGVLDWWYDGGKDSHFIDFKTDAGRKKYQTLATQADLIIETKEPGDLAAMGIDHSDLLVENPKLIQVSITPFGRTGPRSQWVGSDLTAAALGGFLSVGGLPDKPLNVWGRQTYNYAGFMASLCALSGLFRARRDGIGRHYDLSIHEIVSGSVENILMQWLFDDVLPLPKIAARQGSLHWLRAYDLAPCRNGHMMITLTPTPDHAFQMMVDEGFDEGHEWLGYDVEELLEQIDDAMDTMRRWVQTHDAMDLWEKAQERHVAIGAVHEISEACSSPQFEHRNFFAQNQASSVRQPGRLVRFSRTPSNPLKPPPESETQIEEVIDRWSQAEQIHVNEQFEESEPSLPLKGLRVLDLTWVLAGPFATRMLADLGADVIRVQNEEHSTLVNRPDYPYYFVWGRGKRSATLDMKHPQALKTIRKLIENCDVLIENYSAGVLDGWGLDWETVKNWNPRLIYVSMSGCGHDGPWSHVISYAPTVHAICGITHLTNFADRGDVGPGFSLNDHLAGFAAATSTMAAVFERDTSGLGQHIDMAQLEVGTYSIGPAALNYLSNDVAAQPNGNRDGLQDHVPNEVYQCLDGYVAITASNDDQWKRLCLLLESDLLEPLLSEKERQDNREEIDQVIADWVIDKEAVAVVELLQSIRVPAGMVQNAGQLVQEDPQLFERGFWRDVEHPIFGKRVVDTFPSLIDGVRPPTNLLSPSYLGEHNFEVWPELADMQVDEVAEGIGDGLFS